ncbi:alpha/beta hydrolase [Marinospirillum perlucidum]|uniref:alpha/beta hydrolase n=1 Tax=Marinospirillum perlucidum TaxID=1982602 RepID=UPI000DF18643|nr:alpha/beta fold hydrolase [Marinospirillum perlucidum]
MQISKLELLYRLSSNPEGVPVLFVHGIFSGAWIWDEYYLPWFADQGYQAYALSFRGHGRSSAPDPAGQYRLEDYVQDLSDAIDIIRRKHGQEPLLVGHSMGGMVVQSYLSRFRGRGAILLASVPPQGLVPLSWANLFSHPLESLTLSRSYFFPELTTPAEFHQAMFVGPVEADKLLRWMHQLVPESFALLWDMSWLDLPRIHQVRKTPLAVVGARQDRVIPPAMVTLTAATYGCSAYWAEAGHGLMLDSHWQEGARAIDEALTALLEEKSSEATA